VTPVEDAIRRGFVPAVPVRLKEATGEDVPIPRRPERVRSDADVVARYELPDTERADDDARPREEIDE